MCPRYLSYAALPLVVACADATAPAARATVVVQTDTVAATVSTAGTVNWMGFALPIAIHNAGRRPILFEHCASAVEARAGSQWHAVWTPICALPATSLTEIQPGETRELVLSITAAVEGPGGPRWESAEITGTYRFKAGLFLEGRGRALPDARSNAFVLVER